MTKATSGAILIAVGLLLNGVFGVWMVAEGEYTRGALQLVLAVSFAWAAAPRLTPATNLAS